MTSQLPFTAGRYIGNKSRFIPFIEGCLTEYGLIRNDVPTFHTVADLCCGAGAMTSWFANLPGVTKVWATDIQPYAVALTRAHVCNISPAALAEGIHELDRVARDRSAAIDGYEWVIKTRVPSRPMFDAEVARRLARALRHVHELPNGALKIALTGSVLEGALRACNGFGKFDSAPLKDRVRPPQVLAIKPCMPMGAVAKVRVTRSNIMSSIAKGTMQWDLIYIDPPYDSSSTYGVWYHLLNTMLLNDNPVGKGAYGVRSGAIVDDAPLRLQAAAQSFERIFKSCANRCKHIAISYTTTGAVPVDNMRRILDVCGYTDIKTYRKTRRKYAMFGKTHTDAKEVLIIAASPIRK